MPHNADRRDKTRIPVNIPVQIQRPNKPKESIEAEITNISLGGAFVLCRAPMELNQELLIRIQFEETRVLHAKVTEALGNKSRGIPALHHELSVVRWTREMDHDKPGFGVEFANLREDSRRFLERLLSYYEKLIKAGVTF